MNTLLHICKLNEWLRARSQGEYAPDSLTTEGFIHCSTPEQVIATANKFYQNQSGLVLLVIDSDKVIPEIKYEEADGSSFPHIYGPLNLSAVAFTVDFPPDKNGQFDDFDLEDAL